LNDQTEPAKRTICAGAIAELARAPAEGADDADKIIRRKTDSLRQQEKRKRDLLRKPLGNLSVLQ
jgi:hypothetical protein